MANRPALPPTWEKYLKAVRRWHRLMQRRRPYNWRIDGL